MVNQGKRILVFASYATKDANLFKISELAEILTEYDEIHNVLFWQEDMHDNIIEYMNDNLGKCDVMLLFCSPNSMKSVPVKKEWTAADAMGKPIIPIFIKTVHIPPLLRSRLGVEFDTFDFQKTIQALYDLILKKFQKLKIVEPTSLEKKISTNRKKYDYFVNLGENYVKSKQYKEALNNYQNAHKASEELYDANLTIEINNIIKQTENLIKKDREEKEKVRREAQLRQIISFRSAQILQFEADVLQEIEKLTNNQFTLVNKVEFATKMSFSAENQRVNGIGLYECGVSILPESIGNLTSLTHLVLSFNELTTLPDSIGNLALLEMLNLRRNKLTTLPDSIGNLASLTHLNLSSNELTTLPNSIGNLKSLQTLQLIRNQLTTLPESITKLEIIKILRFSYMLNLESNRLTNLPESIGNLTSLSHLNLSSNELTTLPDSIGNLKSLKTLQLIRNQLTTLPESITKLESLEILRLSYNKLKNLPESIGTLTSLEMLNLESNKLTILPESIGNLTSLEKLYLGKNHLTTLPESISNLKSLEILFLRENHLTTLPESIKILEKRGVSIYK